MIDRVFFITIYTHINLKTSLHNAKNTEHWTWTHRLHIMSYILICETKIISNKLSNMAFRTPIFSITSYYMIIKTISTQSWVFVDCDFGVHRY